MKNLTFSAKIAASKQKVWDTMLNLETYREWTGVCWPGSTYDGKWEAGQQLRFTGPGGGGTLAKITSLTPYREVVAEHIAMLLNGGIDDRDSDMAKTWVGATEQYNFTETDGVTELVVTMTIHPDWAEMFSKDWPKALDKLKEICER